VFEAMKLAANRGFDQVVFQSDLQVLVNVIHPNV